MTEAFLSAPVRLYTEAQTNTLIVLQFIADANPQIVHPNRPLIFTAEHPDRSHLPNDTLNELRTDIHGTNQDDRTIVFPSPSKVGEAVKSDIHLGGSILETFRDDQEVSDYARKLDLILGPTSVALLASREPLSYGLHRRNPWRRSTYRPSHVLAGLLKPLQGLLRIEVGKQGYVYAFVSKDSALIQPAYHDLYAENLEGLPFEIARYPYKGFSEIRRRAALLT